MMMCSICKENFAVVFITKIQDGKQAQEGLCLSCAKKQGIAPINQILEQTGMTEEDIDNLNKQVGDIFENIDTENIDNPKLNQKQGSQANPFFNLINKAFPRNEENVDPLGDGA